MERFDPQFEVSFSKLPYLRLSFCSTQTYTVLGGRTEFDNIFIDSVEDGSVSDTKNTIYFIVIVRTSVIKYSRGG